MQGLTVSRARLSVVRHIRRCIPDALAGPRPLVSWLLLSGLVGFVAASSLGVNGCDNAPGIRNETCLVCHNGQNAENMTAFRGGPHKSLQCEECHGSGYLHIRNGGRGGLLISGLEGLNTPGKRDVCKRCHETEVAGFDESVHGGEGVLGCVACHDVHIGKKAAPSANDNEMCLRCHRARGFSDDAAIEAHTFHPVEPATTGASRCTACHLVPIEQEYPGHDFLRHDHSLIPVPPSRSIDAIVAGTPVPPNSCAGVPGCHDGTVLTAPVFDVNDRGTNLLAQILYDERYGPPAAGPDRVAP